MTISDFLYYCYDEGLLTVEIYSIDKGEIVWSGNGYDIPEEYQEAELCSFDIPCKPDYLTLNID